MKTALKVTLIYLSLATAFTTDLWAQDSSLVSWIHQTGGKGADGDAAFAFDNRGHIYQTGVFTGEVDMDPGPGKMLFTSVDASDVFLKKLDKKGRIKWALSFGGKGVDGVTSILFDPSGYIYIIGSFFDEIDLDPGAKTHIIKSVGEADGYISKLDTSGKFIWGKQLSGANDIYCTSIKQTKHRDLVITGHFEGTVDFDPGANTSNKTSQGDYDSYILKLDSSGSFKWAITQRSDDEIVCTQMTIGARQAIYVTGYFRDRAYFHPTKSSPRLQSVQYLEGYIAKYDLAGNFIWVKHLSGQSHELSYEICVDAEDNVYATGMYRDELVIDRGVNQKRFVAKDVYEAFILKVDSNGTFSWLTTLESIEGRTRGFNITTDHLGNVYTAGTLSGTADFDPDTSEYMVTALSYYDDLYVHKLNKNGKFEWVKIMGSTQREMLYSLEVDHNGSVFTSGSFETTTDFELVSNPYKHVLKSAGLSDGFLIRIDQCSNSQSSLMVTSCGPYMLPSGKAIINSSGIYHDTIPNYLGCDSFITLELNILANSYHTMAATACDKYRLPSGRKWVSESGTFTDTLANSVGCDSIITINLDIKNSAESKLKIAECGSYTTPSGKNTYFKSGQYVDTLTTTQGCDSILEIELTISEIDTGISKEYNIIIANESDANYQWVSCDSNSIREIKGATNRSLFAGKSGQYAVIITKGNCTDTSACTGVTTSVNQHLNSSVHFYPNPTNGEITILLNRHVSEGRIQVFNTLGELILDEPFFNTDRINTELTGTNGLHLVRLSFGNEQLNLKATKM